MEAARFDGKFGATLPVDHWLPTTGMEQLDSNSLDPVSVSVRRSGRITQGLLVTERAHSGAAAERPVPRPNGRRIRRAPDREGSGTAADELCPIERPETGRPEIEYRRFTTLQRSAADQFELRLSSHGLNPSVPRRGGVGNPCRTRHRRPGCVVSRAGCRPALPRNS
jgi:hypothetical protein